MTVEYLLLAAVMAVAAILGASFISWRSGWNEMSNPMVLTRAIFTATTTSAAAWLLGTGILPEDDMRVTWAVTAAGIFAFILALHAAFVGAKRRQLVVVWRAGQQLPEAVSEESVRLWTAKHTA